MKSIANQNGYSLVESMIAISIFLFLTGALSTVFTTGSKSWTSFNDSTAAQRETRKAIELISRDFREADSIILTQSSTDVAVLFTHPSASGPVQYTWSTGGNNANQLQRISQGTTRIIANNISAFSLLDAPKTVAIDITSSIQGTGQPSTHQMAKTINKREGI